LFGCRIRTQDTAVLYLSRDLHFDAAAALYFLPGLQVKDLVFNVNISHSGALRASDDGYGRFDRTTLAGFLLGHQ
jgi:hypothetical protein